MKVNHYVRTVHGKQPVCGCGSYMYLVGETPEQAEYICIKCRPDKLKGDIK